MNKIISVLFTAGISLALGFTFGCSSGGGGEGGGIVNATSEANSCCTSQMAH